MTENSIHLETQSANGRRIWYRTAMATAIAAGAFSLAVAIIMIASHAREQANHPLTLTTITSLRQQLYDNPDDDQTRHALRKNDLAIRQSFFERRAFVRRGGYLLLGGSLVVLLAVKVGYRLNAQPYLPDPSRLPEGSRPGAAARARMALGVSALVTAGVFLAFTSMPRYRLPAFAAKPPDEKPAPAVPEVEPTPEMFARNWPAFRGPSGSGIATPGEYPREWNAAAGRNILWKAAVPLPGNNSPVVWEDCVFLAGATENRREIYCFDAATGALRWKQPVSNSPGAPTPQLEEQTGYAPATLATDGRRVYAIFPNGDLVGFDLAGRKVWQRHLGQPENAYGHASSLLTCKGRVIVQLDQGIGDDGDKSAMLAFDGATGQPVWQVKRPVHAAWSSPILAPTSAGPQIVAAGNPLIIAHDPDSGKEIWRAKVFPGGVEVAPSPVFAADKVIVCVDRGDLVAIRPDGQGDVTKTHVAWRFPDNLPDIVSPLSNGELVLMVTTSGMVTCVNAAKGEEVWAQSIESEFNASPALVGNLVYLTDTKGVTYVFEAGNAYKEVSKTELGEEVYASPAFVGGRIYIRGKQNLYCIGGKP